MKGRTYRYFEGEQLYPFGFGLSYTSFRYEDLRVNAGEGAEACVTVTNTGDMAGREVIQAYVRWDGGDAGQPRWHLCAVGNVFLQPGEKKLVALTIKQDALYTYHEDGSRAVEKGSYTLWVGGGQPDERTAALLGRDALKASFTL